MDFLEELNASVLCGDGAMGTELMSSGVPVEVCFEELNVSAPELVSRIHDSYVQAGARLIETNTFGANATRLARHGLQSRVQELNQAAIRLARRSIGQRSIYLAAGIGPLGIVDPQAEFQDIDRAFLFEEQAKAILEAEVDVLMIETFLDFEEIQIALEAVRKLDSKVPVICSMVCSEEGRLPSSLPIVQAFRELIRLGANVVGVNCVTGPHAMVNILRRLPMEFPISAFPNAGYPRYQDGRYLYNAAPDYFADKAKEFVAQGARLIGGCCGVGPEHIRLMAKALAGLKPVRSKPTVHWVAEPELERVKRPVET